MSEISRKLMKLACFFDEHPEFDEFPELFARTITTSFYRHLVGDEAAQLDAFAERFGVAIRHIVHGPKADEPGARYSSAETTVDGHVFEFQCRTEDYEAATGKTVPEPPEAREARLLAEVKHWSDNPIPDDSAVTS